MLRGLVVMAMKLKTKGNFHMATALLFCILQKFCHTLVAYFCKVKYCIISGPEGN